MSNKSLQEEFIQSRGKPVLRNGFMVKQLDVIPVIPGMLYVTIRFVEGKNKDVGIHLDAHKGWIELSDGKHAKSLLVWRSPSFPDEVKHKVYCPEGKITVWNVYRIHHSDNFTTEDKWTGNAGLVVLNQMGKLRRYGCSSSQGFFDPSELVVEIEWELLSVAPKVSST